jgi:agmatinase
VADRETAHNLQMGLPGASSIQDKTIPTFSRGELPHFAGINTFLKAPYIEDARLVGNFDATVVGVPFDGGCTYRAGTRFGPQGIRRISALYTPYNYEKGIDLREQMTLCDVGDVFTIPANIEKSFDQISNAIAHIASTGSFPIILGGDHSIGFPTVRGIASVTTKNIGIIHVDRHADIQEKDLDERMHTTPYFHATNLPNVRAKESLLCIVKFWLRYLYFACILTILPLSWSVALVTTESSSNRHRRVASSPTGCPQHGRTRNQYLHHGRY